MSTPFAAILGVGSIDDQPLTGPTLLSSEFRRLVYRPVELPKFGQGIVSLEVELGVGGEVRTSRVVTSLTDMMVPNGCVLFPFLYGGLDANLCYSPAPATSRSR